jgi:hypothetical protein
MGWIGLLASDPGSSMTGIQEFLLQSRVRVRVPVYDAAFSLRFLIGSDSRV